MNLSDSFRGNTKHLEIVKGGADAIRRWRATNLSRFELEGADLRDLNLSGADLRRANLRGAQLSGAQLNCALLSGADLNDVEAYEANLTGAKLRKAVARGSDFSRSCFAEADCEQADFQGACLKGVSAVKASFADAALQFAELTRADLSDADLTSSNLQGVVAQGITLQGASIADSNAEGAHLEWANLTGATLTNVLMKLARLDNADLRGCQFTRCDLRGTTGRVSLLGAATLFEDCQINDATDFSGAALASPRFLPAAARADLERAVRIASWKAWYAERPPDGPGGRLRTLLVRFGYWLRQWPWRAFWRISGYGTSWSGLLWAFVISTVACAACYCWLPVVWNSSLADATGYKMHQLLEGLRDYDAGDDRVPVPERVIPIRALYFSVVTTTTLGFGDVHPHPISIEGHVLVMIQVIIGYFLLGALITRLGVMLQSLGP